MGQTYNYLVHTKYFLKPQLTKWPGYKEVLPPHVDNISQAGKALLSLLVQSRLFSTWQRFTFKIINCFFFFPQMSLFLFGMGLPRWNKRTNIYWSPTWSRHRVWCSQTCEHLFLSSDLHEGDENFVCLFVSEEGTETQRGKVTCPKSQSWSPASSTVPHYLQKNLPNSNVFFTCISENHVPGQQSSLTLSL